MISQGFLESWAVVLVQAILNRPPHVSVVSWQVNHGCLVQDGLLGLISELTHCHSAAVKASHKPKQATRPTASNSRSEEVNFSSWRESHDKGQGYGARRRIEDISQSIAHTCFLRLRGAGLTAPLILDLSSSFTLGKFHFSEWDMRFWITNSPLWRWH